MQASGIQKKPKLLPLDPSPLCREPPPYGSRFDMYGGSSMVLLPSLELICALVPGKSAL